MKGRYERSLEESVGHADVEEERGTRLWAERLREEPQTIASASRVNNRKVRNMIVVYIMLRIDGCW